MLTHTSANQVQSDKTASARLFLGACGFLRLDKLTMWEVVIFPLNKLSCTTWYSVGFWVGDGSDYVGRK